MRTAQIIPFPQPSPDKKPPSGAARPAAEPPVETRDERLARLRRETAAIMAKGSGPVKAKPSAARGLDFEALNLLKTFHDRGDEAVWLEAGELRHGRECEAPTVFWPIDSRGALTAVREWLSASREQRAA